MAIRKISVWYFGEEDKEEVKKFSKKISIIFKIKGYDPDCDDFFEYFVDLVDFFFIPCIKEGYEETNEDDYEQFEEDAIKALNSAYDSSIRISLDDLEEYAEESGEEEDSVVNLLINAFERSNREIADAVDFIDSCNSEIKQKFVNWLFND